ncbi:TonB-dependent receptor [Polaribacter sp. Z014]|uniref:SusC/RagA family TonB-linked outer membrane protein n=1 Tax=unclassified Polaribacter TaxID=196858 RepID=UPI00193C6BB8|nr:MULTISPECIES: TonB-dependent receptor [unclassified Polaribacter]MCL7764860.1 TonB-dependent receptor [Polaribacter sp. Z014]QVY65027.1 TonB-dependent receptor [Polaribacter sp. Q13]
MNLKIKLVLMLMLFVSAVNYAQESVTVTGSVTSKVDQQPILGANIIIAGTTTGTSTDFDGNYQLKVKSGDVLQFSYVGFASKSVTFTNQKTINVALDEDASLLEEIVVVGYGARKKSDITGSVSSVTADELNAFPVLDAAQAMQGRAAGVVVQSNNGGEPGAPISIKIRGNTSIGASSDPLIVVDGFIGASMPQANDIKSLEILKDASATAIYGSRGSNGVIMVTTKKGRNGKMVVEFNSTFAVQTTANRLDLLNADEFATYQKIIDPLYTQGTADTDWQDLIYTTGATQNHQFSFSGGSDKINFYASGNYFKQDGIIVNSGFEKMTFLSNIDAQISDKLKLGMNLFGSRGTKNGVATQSDGSVTVGGDDVISLAMRFAPDLGVTDSQGVFTTNSVGDPVDNPYAVATERQDETKTDNFRINFYGNYDILENLAFKSTFGLSTKNATRGIYQPSSLIITASNEGGKASLANTRTTNFLNENYLTYKKEIGKGDLTLLAGISYQKNVAEYFRAAGNGFISDSFSYYALDKATTLLQPDSYLQEYEIQSQFGRVNYDYDDKYLITATVRRDGASNFAANHKYAIFPSAALGWKVSNENFLKENETISNLKLRASYGITGNPSIPPYGSLAKLSSLYASSNGQTVNAISTDQAANPDLKWESSYQTNLGVDLGLVNNRIKLSLDYYNIDTKDLILTNAGIPEIFGNTNTASLANLGEINNSGIEIALNTRNISNDNFSWNTDFNLSANKNKVIKLVKGADVFNNGAPSYLSSSGTTRTNVLREGEEVGLFYGYDYAGVYQGGALPEGTAVTAGSVAGDPLFRDVEADGVINAEDRTIIGNPNADFTFGITNNFSYKNFDLSIFFQGSQGGEIFNMTNVVLYNGDANTTRDNLNNAWTPTNTDTNIPRIGNNSNREFSSRFVEDGSYIRLKNIALGYNFPSEVIENLGIDNLRLSVSAQNLLTITDYSGLDPEVNYAGSSSGNANQSANTVSGFDFGNYPTVKSVNFSLNIKF